MNKEFVKRRELFYCIVAWLAVGLVILYASFFTYSNGLKKLTFSEDGDDVYEIYRKYVTEGLVIDGRYAIGFPVDFSHCNIQYLKVSAEGINNNDVTIGFYGGQYNENTGEIIATTEVKIDSLYNGNNYYKLDSLDYSYFVLFVDGMGVRVVKDVQFTETTKEKSYNKTQYVLLLSTISVGYVFISAIVSLCIKKLKSSHYT